MIEVCSLTQRYGQYTAVEDVSFQLAAGEVVGFLGPNGAGKSTTLKVLATYLAPTRGTAVVGGHDVRRDPLAVRRALGYLPEHCPLYGEMVVRDFLSFVAKVRGLSPAERATALARVTEHCRLEEVIDRPCSDLSKGYRQRVGIAQALLHDPKILILDEPTSGLDPNQVLEVRQLVRELGRQRTVLFSSHILSEVEATCPRVVVINHGRLVADGQLEGLKQRITGGSLRVRFASPPEDVAQRLRGVEGVASVDSNGSTEGLHLVRPEPEVDDLAARLFRFAAGGDLVITELAPVTVSLEDVFGTLTGAGGG